jgi:serine protease Do
MMQAMGRDFKAISQQVTPAVVSLSVKSRATTTDQPERERFEEQYGFEHPPIGPSPAESEVEGSGVIVDARKGYVLTNHHVIAHASQIEVTLPDGKTCQARVIGTDPPTDLAVIQLEKAPNLAAARLGNSDQIRVGEWVLAIGSPFGLRSSVTAGIVSARSRADIGVADFEDFIQTDAAINPGNSGGALVNIRGEVIGINTAIASRNQGYMGIGFAIPSNLARKVMESLIRKGRVIRSQLGILIGPADELMLKGLGIPAQTQGILVMDVFPDTPAAQAGVQKYDLVVGLNGKPVQEVQPFRNQIALTPPESEVRLELFRGKQRLTRKIILKEMSRDSLGQPLTPEQPALLKKLGLKLEALNDSLRGRLGLPADLQGLLITGVDEQAPAWQQGLRSGDLITEINQQPVSTLEAFYQILEKPDTEVLLLNIIREQQSLIRALRLPVVSKR